MTTPIQPVDGSLLGLLRDGVHLPSLQRGTWATPRTGDLAGAYEALDLTQNLADLGHQLAAYGCPALDLPTTMGGLGVDSVPHAPELPVPERRDDGVPEALTQSRNVGPVGRPNAWAGPPKAPGADPGAPARVAVIAPFVTDTILALSTLPGLAHALREQGADVTLHTVWDKPFNPHDPGLSVPLTGSAPRTVPADATDGVPRFSAEIVHALANTPARIAFARQEQESWLAGLDLSKTDLVVVAGLDAGFDVLHHPTLPAHTRVVIADFHLMSGMQRWYDTHLPAGQRSMDGGWWPDDRAVLHALYPRYVRAYWRAGVPTRQIRWRPYPLARSLFSPGPDTATCTRAFAGGNHQRDWATLAAAMASLPEADRPALDLCTAAKVPAPLRSLGELPLPHFYERLAASRFVVLPMTLDNRRPAGISVISLALAAGRPLVCSATPAALDHLRHGKNALLVPPGRPKALARAIQRLATDETLLATLTQGAQTAAHELSVQRWAEVLLTGGPQQAFVDDSGTGQGPFHAWHG